MNTSSQPTQGNKRLLIEHLKLANFRRFAKLDISFDDRLTVLVANNGQGKTAILDALAIALGPFVGAFDDGKDRIFGRDDIRLIPVGRPIRMESADGGIALDAIGSVNHRSASWRRGMAGPKSKTTHKDAAVLRDFGKDLQSQVRREADGLTTGVCLPLVAYYPTDRLSNLRRLPYKKLPHTSRMVGYTHCLESGSDFRLMAEWFRYWSINALDHRLKAQQAGTPILRSEYDDILQAVRDAINLCLKPSGWGNIGFSVERQEIVANHPQFGELPVGMLSDGIRSVLTLVADIAFRAVKLNPNMGSFAATNTDGIVLIDEVDMHLHPEWQQTVLASLLEAFPKIQFIVTTHSPQVLSTVRRENIRVIGENSAGNPIAESPLFGSYGEPSGDVMHGVMGVDPQPPVAEKPALQRLTELVDQGAYRSEEAKQIFESLSQELGEQHPQLQRLRRSIQRQEVLNG